MNLNHLGKALVGAGTVVKRSSRLGSMRLEILNGRPAADVGSDTLGIFSRRVGQALATNIVMTIVGLASGLLAARMLGPQGRGHLAAIQCWPMLFAALAMLGTPEAVVYYSSRNPDRAAEYLGTSRVIALISGVAFLALGWLLMPSLLRSQSLSTVWFARVYLFMIPLYALIDLPRNALRTVGAWGTWNALRLVHASLWLGVLVGGWVIPRLANPGALACLFLGLQAIFAAPHSLVISRYIPGSYTVAPDLRGPLVQFGIPTMATILPQTLNLRLDQLLMASFLGPQPLGYYVVAVAWAGAATPVFQAVGAVLFPHISAMPEPLLHHEFLKVFLYRVLMAVACITILLLALTPLAIRLLFGMEFRPSTPAALILTIASGFSGLNLVLSAGLQGYGRPKSILKAELLGLAVTSLSLAVLLPSLGIVGAALSSLCTYSSITVFMTTSFFRIHQCNAGNIDISRNCIIHP